MAIMKWIDSAVIRNDSLYCLPGNGGYLYKIALKDFSIGKTIKISKHSSRFWRLFVKNNDFYCVSKSGNEIVCWNETTEEKTILEFNIKMPERCEIIDYKDKIWMIPREISEDLYYYSIAKSKYYKSKNWRKFVKSLKISGRVERWHHNDNNVYLIIKDEKKVLKFDMDTEQLTDFIVPVDDHIKDLVVQQNKFYFLLDNNTAIHCWNPQSGSVFMIDNMMQESCYKLIVVGDAIVIDAGNSVVLLRNDKINKTDIVIEKQRETTSAFLKAIKYKSSWIVMPWGHKAFITFSENFDLYRINTVLIPTENVVDTEPILHEGGILLKEWLQYLTEKNL